MDKEPNKETSSEPQEEPQETEELAHYDDAVIGRAFRWSAVVFLFLALVVAGIFFALKEEPVVPKEQVTEIEAPEIPQRPQAEIPTVEFTDITDDAGIDFVHNNGAYGDKLLPETMGGGVAFLDFDADGDQDLLFVNSNYWPWKVPEGKKETTSALYRNDGTGQFENVTAGSGLDVPLYGMGAAVGDYDNDGLTDVFLTAVGENKLFHNLGDGKFEEVTDQANVAGDPDEWSTSSAFIDYDNDGDLDLFVCNYVRWSREIDFEVGYTLVGIGRAYGPPMNFAGTYPYFYENNGDGTFTDISGEAGVQIKNPATNEPMAKSLAVAPVDLDEDGYIDIIVANDTVRNFVFSNQKDGTFKEIGRFTGVAFDNYGNTRGAMGIDTAHHRNNESLAIGIGNFANEMTALYVSQGDPHLFTDEAIAEGVGPQSRLLLKFGLFFFDYDLNGWMDLLTANGHLEEEISQVQQSQHFKQPAQLFWNAGATARGGFVAVSPEKAGQDLFKPIVGRGSAFADIDGDGDLDVVLTQVGGPPLLLRNDQDLGHHWIRFDLTGNQVNRSAIGARVELKWKDQTLTRQVMPARSYLSQSERPVTFGLGDQTTLDSVNIIWPGGKTQKLTDYQLDAVNHVTQK